MIVGIGCDIIEIERVARAIEKVGFKQRVFTPGEIAYAENRGKQAAASYAARFAAKEAVLKALGTGLRGGSLLEIQVTNDELGKPSLELSGYHKELAQSLGIVRWQLSLSHNRDSAIAYVVAEGKVE